MIDWIVHIDHNLGDLVAHHGVGAYLILAAILFGETGLLVLPFLPGDTLLFACGVLAAQKTPSGEPVMSLATLLTLLPLAATLGDTTNYWIGRGFRRMVVARRRLPFLSGESLERAHLFFERYGPWAVVLGRWVPLVRTVVPFTAGVTQMTYSRFLPFSILGNLIWVVAFIMLGFQLGHYKVVRDHIGLVFIGLAACVLVSILLKLLAGLRKQSKMATPGELPAQSE
jgi:membrane-associated protein